MKHAGFISFLPADGVASIGGNPCHGAFSSFIPFILTFLKDEYAFLTADIGLWGYPGKIGKITLVITNSKSAGATKINAPIVMKLKRLVSWIRPEIDEFSLPPTFLSRSIRIHDDGVP